MGVSGQVFDRPTDRRSSVVSRQSSVVSRQSSVVTFIDHCSFSATVSLALSLLPSLCCPLSAATDSAATLLCCVVSSPLTVRRRSSNCCCRRNVATHFPLSTFHFPLCSQSPSQFAVHSLIVTVSVCFYVCLPVDSRRALKQSQCRSRSRSLVVCVLALASFDFGSLASLHCTSLCTQE